MTRARIPPALDRLLTADEVAALLGMSRCALYALVARGQIPYRKRGQRLVFLVRELQTYLAALDGLTVEQWRQGGGSERRER